VPRGWLLGEEGLFKAKAVNEEQCEARWITQITEEKQALAGVAEGRIHCVWWCKHSGYSPYSLQRVSSSRAFG
jgi:hypothetical protein